MLYTICIVSFPLKMRSHVYERLYWQYYVIIPLARTETFKGAIISKNDV